jgi:hypothetical protein
MSFNPNFSTSQSAATLSSVTFTDTSTGTDGAITGRLIYLRKYQGTYLVPTNYTTEYIYWPYSDATITIPDLLDKDYSLDVIVYWFVGSSAPYSKTILTGFTGYSDYCLRQLTQNNMSNRQLLSNKNFYNNKIKLRTLVDDCNQAILLLNDQTISQWCLDQAKLISDHINTFF